LDRLHIRVHLWWGSRWSRRLLVVTGARAVAVPLTKPVVTAVELRVDHRAPLQPRRAARRYLRICGAARADSRRSGVGLAPRPQALPMPAAALVLYIRRSHVLPKWEVLAENSAVWEQLFKQLRLEAGSSG
jgi:hypothetical protein